MIYLDNAATTRVTDEVFEVMKPYFTKQFANPSASYRFGHEAKNAIEKARVYCAELINAEPSEIIFTSGGTESDNTAVFSVSRNSKVITSKAEHHAVLNPCKILEKRGINVIYLTPDK